MTLLHLRLRLLIVAFCIASTCVAEDGVSDNEIKVGQCAALQGPAAGLGTNMKFGIEAYLQKINDAGGVQGRKITLTSVDDGYEPEKTVDETLKLIDEVKVFSLIGYVGTPTAKVAMPIVAEKKVPLVGLFTGAMLLRAPIARYILNIRASYDDETEALVQHLVDDLKIKKIGVFYQDDSFGLAGLAGTQKALKKRSMDVACTGKFPRNTVAVKTGLSSIIEGQPEAVIMVGPYKPVAEFVKAAKEAQLNTVFVTISFVGTENLIKELGPLAEKLVISQVVPPPDDESVPVVKEFREALKKCHAEVEPNFVALEGYITAKVFALALDKTGKDVTREKFVDTMESLQNVDIGGMPVSFSKESHQGLNRVYLTQVSSGRAKAVNILQETK